MPHAVATRDPEATAPYARALAALGLDTIAMPVTRTAPPTDPTALPRALAQGHAAILVASPRAAAALAAAGPVAAPVWAVGPATARALEAAGIAAIVPADARDGATVAAAMIAAGVTGRIVVPRAEDGRDEAIARLRAAGREVDPVVVYRTVATPADAPELVAGRDLLRAGGAAVCCVFAPSQVAALDALVGVRGLPTRWAAIGDTTAAALRALGAAPIAVAASPTPAAMANAVAAVYPAPR